MGIKDLDVFSRALLGKWVWRVLEKGDVFWVRILRSKYGDDPFDIEEYGVGVNLPAGGGTYVNYIGDVGEREVLGLGRSSSKRWGKGTQRNFGG